MGTPLMAGDTVEVLGLGDVVIDALIVDEWGMLRFVYGSRTQPAICCKLLHRPVAAVAAPTAGRGLGPYTPATVYRAFELLSHAHDMLTRCPLPLGPAGHEFIADIASLLEDADRQRMNAAAAHALDMQTAGDDFRPVAALHTDTGTSVMCLGNVFETEDGFFTVDAVDTSFGFPATLTIRCTRGGV